jgi:hypothetical protein
LRSTGSQHQQFPQQSSAETPAVEEGSIVKQPPESPLADGRDCHGRFTKGNRGGPGNPHAAQVSRLRTALLSAVTERDMREVIVRLVQLSKDGDVRAIKELLDRTLGKPQELDLLERLEQLEAQLAQGGPRWG